MATEIRVTVNSPADLVTARQRGRALAQELGFGGSDLTVIATAISEITRNILEYAGTGELVMRAVKNPNGRAGIAITAHDEGPGIPNIPLAMQDGFSTGRGLGLGLPGTRRLMDEFEVRSTLGRGTKVIMTKWLPSSEPHD